MPLQMKYGLDKGYAKVSVDTKLIVVPINVIKIVTKRERISALSRKIIL